MSIRDADGLTQAIGQALDVKVGALSGTELRRVGSAGMGLPPPALGKLVGIDGQSIGRGEKTRKCRVRIFRRNFSQSHGKLILLAGGVAG